MEFQSNEFDNERSIGADAERSLDSADRVLGVLAVSTTLVIAAFWLAGYTSGYSVLLMALLPAVNLPLSRLAPRWGWKTTELVRTAFGVPIVLACYSLMDGVFERWWVPGLFLVLGQIFTIGVCSRTYGLGVGVVLTYAAALAGTAGYLHGATEAAHTAAFTLAILAAGVLLLFHSVRFGAVLFETRSTNREMRFVLDNVDQGFLSVDRTGAVAAQRSAVVDTWFGSHQPGAKLWDILGTDSKTAGMLRMGWEQVVDGLLPVELALGQLPDNFVLHDRHYHVDYTPVVVEEQLTRALVVITDQTDQIERERVEADQREVMGLFDKLAEDKRGVVDFFQEAARYVHCVCAQETEDVAALLRALHTLKGNAMTFGLNTVANLCHEMERKLSEDRMLPNLREREQLAARWSELQRHVGRLLGESGRDRIEVDLVPYQAVLTALRERQPHERVAQMVAGWRLEPVEAPLRRLAEQARGICRRIGKTPVAIEIDAEDLRLDPRRWAPFWGALVHVIRNALDHGFESAETRERAGKPAVGRLEFVARLEQAEFVLTLRDDGQGIDWQRVAARAKEAGLPHETQADLVEAVFADGLSTQDQVTHLSGRGVGLAAVREACRACGGTVSIDSTPGEGTSFRFLFPAELLAPAAAAIHAA